MSYDSISYKIGDRVIFTWKGTHFATITETSETNDLDDYDYRIQADETILVDEYSEDRLYYCYEQELKPLLTSIEDGGVTRA